MIHGLVPNRSQFQDRPKAVLVPSYWRQSSSCSFSVRDIGHRDGGAYRDLFLPMKRCDEAGRRPLARPLGIV